MKLKYAEIPFNVDLLILLPTVSRTLKKVTSLTTLIPSTQDFDPNGLFSTEIFGNVGDVARSTTFAYIDLNAKVLHPKVFKSLISLKQLYKDIMAGTKYAVFDEKIKDFVVSNPTEGNTGYAFFLSRAREIDFGVRESSERNDTIKIAKIGLKPESMMDKMLVWPAGLRDYYVDDAGVPKEDEVNDLYRSLMSVANLLKTIKVTPSTEHTIDSVRYRLQLAVVKIYEHFINMLDGKHKMLQGKWTKRGVAYSNRNVLTPALPVIDDVDDKDIFSIDHARVGLYQFVMGLGMLAHNRIHGTIINKILSPDSLEALLVNPKTMKSELTKIDVRERDKWLSLEGLSNTLASLKYEDIRNLPIKINGKYLLVVHDKDDVITVVYNTANLSSDLDPKYLRPVTYFELVYLCVSPLSKKLPGILTRYPVIELGGTFPAFIYLKSTENPRTVTVNINHTTYVDKEYPNSNEAYVNSMSIHPSHMETTGSDFDGDMLGLHMLFLEDSIKEVRKVLDSKTYYLHPSGGLAFNPINNVSELVIKTLAGVRS